jgi:peptidoglycan/LPS O-acetylase OafA/YrhL
MPRGPVKKPACRIAIRGARRGPSPARTRAGHIPRRNRLDNIDLLRAIAILAVVAFHYTALFPAAFYHARAMPFTFSYGYLGVDLFFVVSGYCIFMTIDRSATWQNFLARRIARIQPAYTVAIFVTFAVVSLAGPSEFRVSFPAALSNIIWLEAIPRWPRVDGVYWSLVVELQFYFWIGLIFYISRGRRIAAKWAAFTALGTVLSGIGLARVVLISPYAAAFLAGILAWEWDRLSKAERWPLAMVTIFLFMASPRFAGMVMVGPAIGLFGFAVLRWKSLKLPKGVTYIGLISYSLYLLHQFVGYAIIRNLAPLPIELRLAITFVAIVGASALSYHLIERGFEKWAIRHIEPLLGRCRHVLRIPYREIPHATLEAQIRAW